MRANDFIKKFGFEKAKLLLSTQGKTIAELKGEYTTKQLKEYQGYIVSGDLMSFVDLKRLVESYKIVNFYGGIQNAKEIVKISVRSGYGPSSLSDINQAIADVESCQ